MTRRLLLACALLLVATLAAGLAVAHGNHATATPQVSANGSVVVEEAFVSSGGHLVLHADDDGQPGRVIGHRPLRRGLYGGLRVDIDPAVWRNVSGTTTVWATVHADDGDGTFEPGEDELLYWFDEPAGSRIPVRKANAPVVVVAGAGSTDGAAVPVQQVALASRGHVVVHTVGATNGTNSSFSVNGTTMGTLGQPIGHRTLPAGTHEEVTVPVTPPADAGEALSVLVAVHEDDGDGTFGPEDPPVRVAGQPVASGYALRLDGTATPGVRVNTPSPTASSPSPTSPPMTPTSQSSPTVTPTTHVDGPGFGFALALFSLGGLGGLLAILARGRE